ncbi:MAG: SDR family oxidoreductase [Candidatus Latescibacteria bacterium]|nr:SDR family oxidoreductase [Candidatus Latescibacterota bacterium]
MHVKELFNIQGRVAVVTGGSGLYGRCIVEGLCEAGAKVIIASRNLKNCKETASFYRNQGYEAYAYSLDLSSHKSVVSLAERVWQDFGRVDILVNNSVLRPMKGYADHLSAWRKSMDVNATGLLDITRCFVEKMIPQRKGTIINISSMYGLVGPDFTLYEGTDMPDVAPDYWFHKAGMINLTRYFASRFGKYNIRVNTISPGGLFNYQPELFLERYAKRVFLGRMANQDDIKGVVVFLASDASAYITGANIVMDGGYTCK